MYRKINTKTGEVTPIATIEELRTEIWAAIERMAPEFANDLGTMNEVSEIEWQINNDGNFQMANEAGDLDDYRLELITPPSPEPDHSSSSSSSAD